MARSAYIHIPFCAHKCDFCDFAAFAGVDDLEREYCDVVIREIEGRLRQIESRPPLRTVFYGGGTPGYIQPEELARIHLALEKQLGFEPSAEINMETTPHSITVDKAKAWLEMGINRLSIGVQSFNDSELKAMGRDHTCAQAIAGIEAAKEAGFDSIGIDLMYGLPEQTEESWQKTLETALSMGTAHISAYGLTIAGNSPLLVRYPLDSGAYPPEEGFVRMYEQLVNASTEAGLNQYEISNFAKPGYESAHNKVYWLNEEYFAFGVSAHRYVDGVRSSNFRALKRYMRDYLSDETSEVIEPEMQAREAIMLGLRMRVGLDLADFADKYGFAIEERRRAQVNRLIESGFMELDHGRLRLTQKGVLVSNSVISELI